MISPKLLNAYRLSATYWFSERELGNPLALCELAARAPNISAGQIVKQAWLLNERVFILDFDCHALM
ncbi:MAG: hypothetical protein KJO34_07630 [Deltaproteobacteria bacterium]|nr:hypothetical protein [Deltaproteobacteria bacterium]